MSAFVKTKLKSARDYISKKDFAKARDAAADVLSYEPENYNALVFLGVSSLELGEYDKSEQAYRDAIKCKPDQLLAWQGLLKFYEKREQWNKVAEITFAMMDLYAKNEDATKLAELLQKYIEHWRRHGTRKEIISALELCLPESKFYSVLSTLPPPDPTSPEATTTLAIQQAIHNSLPVIEEIVSLMESEETESMKREIDKRRTRIGSGGPEQVRKEVGLEIWSDSKLPSLYNEILNHPNTSDELRRQTESKLLLYKYNYLCALPVSGEKANLKRQLWAEVQDMANGIVLLSIPNELAWTLHIEGKDVDAIHEYDYSLLRRFTLLFKDHPLTHFIRAYFSYYSIALVDKQADDEEDDENQDSVEEDGDYDPYNSAIDAVEKLPNSLLAHHGLGDIYVSEEDYQNAITLGEKGLELVRARELDFGKKLSQVRKAFNVILATGLVHLFPPKHHSRAIRVLDDVLAQDPDNTACLMGRAYVYQAAKRWQDAADLFSKVVSLSSDDSDKELLAREEYAWCLLHIGQLDEAMAELESVKNEIEQWENYDYRKARVWWRLGTCYWQLGESKRDDAYKHFVTALKRNPNFAPAFTSLGVYYEEGVTPPDPTRAAKCFQKAFELDARETEAAQRLAHSFAEEREWDLVEVVVRRAIEGEGGLSGGLGDQEAAIIAKRKPTNAWAWKALGVVELNQRNYAEAIQAFQVALRSDEHDALSWLRLGEAYAKAGRHAAALKALNRSLELQPENWLCKYELGDVYRVTGQLPQAISVFLDILKRKPEEPVVMSSLAASYLALGRSERTSGYLSRSYESFLGAIDMSLRIMKAGAFSRVAWKTVGDALLELSEFATFPDPTLAFKAFREICDHHPITADGRLEGVLKLPVPLHGTELGGKTALSLAVVAYSSRLSLFSKDEEGADRASFDFGVALSRFAPSLLDSAMREKAMKDSVEAVRQALIKDSGNPSYWNVFGILNFSSDPKVAQHSFIRALEVNSKDVAVWTNLGFLYLHNQDPILANEAFFRAQTLDPDYTLAWVGQGLVASANGHDADARALFAHAISLSSDIPEADFEYSFRMFKEIPNLMSRGRSQTSKELSLPSFFSLDRYCRRRTDDASALHLFGLVCERLHHYDLGISVISQAIKILEVSYEETEDPVIEKKYATANANLGRLLLATGNYGHALDTFEAAVALIPSDNDEDSNKLLRTLCQFGSGIAHFNAGNLQDALEQFEAALQTSQSSPLIKGQITVLLSQTLWALGTEEFRESAKSQLLESISDDPENLAAITALAAMGLLTDDEALIDAALSEIIALPLQDRFDRDKDRDVPHLLMKHYIAEGAPEKAVAVAQRDVHSEPAMNITRLALSTLQLQLGQPEVAYAILSKIPELSSSNTPEDIHKTLSLLAVAISAHKASEEDFRDLARTLAQKAVQLAPWDSRTWLCLSYVCNR